MRNVSIFSFFAGAGFLDLGFEHENAHICYVNECHQPFLDAYRYSRTKMELSEPSYGYEAGSIEDIDDEILSSYMAAEATSGNLVGFIGGPPCPDFSVGGKNKGKEGENGKLSKTYTDLICKLQPDFFLFENVKGLYRTKKHRSFFESLKRNLRRSGYKLTERLINSIEYGAPQDRERIILVGFRGKKYGSAQIDWIGREYPDKLAFEFDWPQTNSFELDGEVITPDGIDEKLTVQHWFTKNQVENHPNATHFFAPRAGLTRFLSVDEGDVAKKSYKRLHRWRYSPTAAYGNNEVHLHPYKPRRITVAEALAIQSLPREFVLPPTMTLTNMFKTIGNGVPYLAARGLAQSIFHHIERQNESISKQFSERDKSAAA